MESTQMYSIEEDWWCHMKCVLLNKGKGPLSWALKNMSIVTYVLTQFCSWNFFLDTHLNAVIESVDQILFLDRFYFISIPFEDSDQPISTIWHTRVFEVWIDIGGSKKPFSSDVFERGHIYFNWQENIVHLGRWYEISGFF